MDTDVHFKAFRMLCSFRSNKMFLCSEDTFLSENATQCVRRALKNFSHD